MRVFFNASDPLLRISTRPGSTLSKVERSRTEERKDQFGTYMPHRTSMAKSGTRTTKKNRTTKATGLQPIRCGRAIDGRIGGTMVAILLLARQEVDGPGFG